MKKALKKIAGIFCLIECIVGICILFFMDMPEKWAVVITIAIFAFLAYLCLRKPKRNPNTDAQIASSVTSSMGNTSSNNILEMSESHANAENRNSYLHINNHTAPIHSSIYSGDESVIPGEVLDSMRQNYSVQQAENDARVLNDSIHLMKSTVNLKTFFDRYELAMQKAQTLMQAQRAGIPLGIELNFTESLMTAKSSILPDLLKKSYAKELKAINNLKTVNGKMKRIEKYLDLLYTFEDEFEFESNDIYNEIVGKLNIKKQSLIQEH